MDEADQAFYKWKKCIQCVGVESHLGPLILPYTYDSINESCGMLINKFTPLRMLKFIFSKFKWQKSAILWVWLRTCYDVGDTETGK